MWSRPLRDRHTFSTHKSAALAYAPPSDRQPLTDLPKPEFVNVPKPEFVEFAGKDIPGYDLVQNSTQNLAGCSAQCEKHPYCVAFTWPGCQLKGSRSTVPSSDYTVYCLQTDGMTCQIQTDGISSVGVVTTAEAESLDRARQAIRKDNKVHKNKRNKNKKIQDLSPSPLQSLGELAEENTKLGLKTHAPLLPHSPPVRYDPIFTYGDRSTVMLTTCNRGYIHICENLVASVERAGIDTGIADQHPLIIGATDKFTLNHFSANHPRVQTYLVADREDLSAWTKYGEGNK